MSKNNKYSKETKLEVVRKYLDEGDSEPALIKEYGIRSTLSIRRRETETDEPEDSVLAGFETCGDEEGEDGTPYHSVSDEQQKRL